MTDTCTCPPDDCHGGHTIQIDPAATRLDRVRAWLLAHDWTETSEGDTGWMWQHTSGRKIGIFRRLDDPHLWEGIIGRLAVTHGCHPSDIEREILGDDPVPHLTDEHLRRIAQYVHPDETTDYVRPWLHSMAAELLKLRRLASSWSGRLQELTAQGAELERRGRQLEAAQREPIGYAVVRRPIGDGAAAVVWSTLDQARTAEGIASGYAIHPTVAEAISSVGRSDQPAGSDLVLVELREVAGE